MSTALPTEYWRPPTCKGGALVVARRRRVQERGLPNPERKTEYVHPAGSIGAFGSPQRGTRGWEASMLWYVSFVAGPFGPGSRGLRPPSVADPPSRCSIPRVRVSTSTRTTETPPHHRDRCGQRKSITEECSRRSHLSLDLLTQVSRQTGATPPLRSGIAP